MRYLLFAVLAVWSFTGFSQKNIQLLGHYTYPGGVVCSNLSGYADTAGNEYALVGTNQGLSIVNITNPATPVQLFLVPGATGNGASWREVREYKGYAYVTTEAVSGLVVANLNYLPDSVPYHTINPSGMVTSHTIFIDENGIAYINGTDRDQIFLDLNANPWNPPVLGRYTTKYVHDCFVRNDTMWASHINDGVTSVIDVTNKTTVNAPVNTLATWATPSNFSHNAWLSDDSKYLFTTDEKPNSFLTCYDVTNLGNITETDRTQINPGSNTIIHNTYFLNEYCITSYYTYGVTIHDVLRKNNLVETGNYDTSPFSGDGFNGAWGVWPYLPSGNLIVSDIQTGLWILKPTYQRACYLEGVVRDSLCNSQLGNVKIEIVGAGAEDFSKLNGQYSMGTPDSGTYTIRFSKQGYQTVDVPGVVLRNGQLNTINIALVPVSTASLVIKTVDSLTGNPLPFVRVLIKEANGNTYQEIATNNNAEYSFCDFVQGSYNFYAGRWGLVTTGLNKAVTNAADTIVFKLTPGYYDDFVMDYGWTVSGNASSGDWERGEPDGTSYNGQPANPNVDVTGDYSNICYVTGNNGGQAGEDDIDNGNTILRSPLFDLSSYNDPYLSYYRWFFNDGGNGDPINDSLRVTLTNGIDTVLIDTIGPGFQQSQWQFKNVRIKDFLTPTANMRIFFKAEDYDEGHLVEAALDLFSVVDSAATPVGIASVSAGNIAVYPNPVTNRLHFGGLTEPVIVAVYNSRGELVISETITANQFISMSGLADGLYVVRYNGLHTMGTTRVLKASY